MSTISRRELVAMAALLPGFDGIARATRPLRSPIQRLDPVDVPVDWDAIAEQFVIEGVHLNTGTYGACPIPVIEATIHHLRAFERITRQEHPDLAAVHESLEGFLGAWPGSVAIVRNTTEAMNVAANGIDLKPGDEVLTTTHEHIGGRCCWELLERRRGVKLRKFVPPLDPAGDDELVAAWEQQIGPRTRVLSIAHVLFTTGMIQPVARLVRLARERGIISVVDGAHPPGMMKLDLTAIDADYYATSPHKWLLAPKGTGLLITRPDRLERTWPLIASGDWESDDYRKFEHLGTSNESLVAGLAAAVEWQAALGRETIEARSRGLATRLHEQLAMVPGVHITSPSRPAQRSAMVSFTKDGTTAEQLQHSLGRAGFRTRRIAEFDLEYLRLSTHVYVLPDQLDRAVEIIGTTSG